MRVLVIGIGHVGSATCLGLANAGHDVLALARTPRAQAELTHPKIRHCSYEVIKRRSGHYLRELMKAIGPTYDAVVSCVGDCPPGGFKDAIRTPLSKLSRSVLSAELDLHPMGCLNIFQEFHWKMANHGHFVFMSTAATRILEMPLSERPPVHIYHHLAAIAAQDALIQGMRMDPNVDVRGIKIHTVRPPRIVDSPFHQSDAGLPPGSTAPVGVTTQQVVEQIMFCISVGAELGHQDIDMAHVTPP